MNFYEIWNEVKFNNISEQSFLSDFLSFTEPSTFILKNGTKKAQEEAQQTIKEIKKDMKIDYYE